MIAELDEDYGRAAGNLTELRARASSPATDVALVMRRAAGGDARAWERLVDQYAALIWSITAQFRLAESDAADVAQTIWLRLLEHIDRIEYPDRIASWLASTARNECLRILAARKRIVLASNEQLISSVVASEPAVGERILADERDQVVHDALSQLPYRQGEVLSLTMDGYSPAEIAAQLGIEANAVRVHLHRARAKIRALIAATGGLAA